MERIEAAVEGIARTLDTKFQRLHDDLRNSRTINWQPITAMVAVAVTAIAFGIGLWVAKSDAHVRDVIAGGDRLLVTMHEHHSERIKDLDVWRDDMREWIDQINRDLGRVEAQLAQARVEAGTIKEVSERTRWLQGSYDEALSSLKHRLESIEGSMPRTP